MTPNNPVAARLLQDLAHGDAFVRMNYQGVAHLLPVALRDDVRLDDLLGIDRQKTALLANLDNFLDGKPCSGARAAPANPRSSAPRSCTTAPVA